VKNQNTRADALPMLLRSFKPPAFVRVRTDGRTPPPRLSHAEYCWRWPRSKPPSAT
jgi:hypothetical protein